MEEKGYLLLVLHTHLPFVRHPECEYALEENWLFEAITECYIPLIEVFQRLVKDEADFKVTFSLTPCLLAMLTDSLLQSRYLRYIEERILLSEKELERLKDQPQLLRLAKMYHQKFIRCRKIFLEDWKQDLTAAFKYLHKSGKIEIIASGATHAYFPLWENYPQIVELQIQTGIQQHQAIFGKRPLGFWMPECGYFPGVDNLVQKEGIKYFFLESHGILNGHPKPRFGEYAAIHCPSGVAAFGRELETRDWVWTKDKGYPGDPFYLKFDSDIGYELDLDYLFPFIHYYEHAPTGIKYSCNGAKDPYDPDMAFSRCEEHANNFIYKCQKLVENFSTLGRKPVVVAMFDTEHFGHWWNEGPTWLNLVIRKLAYDQKSIKLITAIDYLKKYPVNQVVSPSMSSWGYQGYSETWLMGRNHWIYPPLFEAIELLEIFIKENPILEAEHRSACGQYLRELLLAQSSDWAYIMHSETAQKYAEKRVQDHIQNMRKIYQQLNHDTIDSQWLNSTQNKNNIFLNIDLFKVYEDILRCET